MIKYCSFNLKYCSNILYPMKNASFFAQSTVTGSQLSCSETFLFCKMPSTASRLSCNHVANESLIKQKTFNQKSLFKQKTNQHDKEKCFKPTEKNRIDQLKAVRTELMLKRCKNCNTGLHTSSRLLITSMPNHLTKHQMTKDIGQCKPLLANKPF